MLSPRSSSSSKVPAHNVFTFDNITFSSNFDNGNLARVERAPNRPYEFKIWSAPDNMGTEHQSRHCAWFYFTITGLPMGCVLRIQVVNASSHPGLYKHDMRPVYRGNSTNNKWCRIKTSVRFIKEGDTQQLFYEHSVDSDNDKLQFAFTYPYTYTQMQSELDAIDVVHHHNTHLATGIFYQRELLTRSCDGRRVDLLTITSLDGMSKDREPLLSGLFPDARKVTERPPIFPEKEVIFISCRVHSGEVPAQHTFKGILDLLLDKDDLCGKELRARYVFKLIPMLNPDGVYRGHFRMDQHGQNLNRYYINPDLTMQPAIYAAKSLLDYYSENGFLSVYLDMHAHASKRGCFIYGNVLDSVEDQIQNQLYCKLISMNTPHFDYEGCLFSREHMFRTDPGDQAKGLTAEGSGRVATYLAYGLVHSYTLECNYNTSRIGNEVAPPEQDLCGQNVTPASPFTTNPEKYTPLVYAGVGRACIVAMLDIRGQNPCSRIPKSKLKTLDRVRNAVVMEVRNRKEYLGKQFGSRDRRRTVQGKLAGCSATQSDEFVWRRVIESLDAQQPPPQPAPVSFKPSGPITSNAAQSGQIMFIPAGKERKRRSSLSALPTANNNSAAPPASSNNETSLIPPPNSTTTTSSAVQTPTPMSSSHSHLVVKSVVQDMSSQGSPNKYVLSPQSGHKNKLQDFFQGVQKSNTAVEQQHRSDPDIMIFANHPHHHSSSSNMDFVVDRSAKSNKTDDSNDSQSEVSDTPSYHSQPPYLHHHSNNHHNNNNNSSGHHDSENHNNSNQDNNKHKTSNSSNNNHNSNSNNGVMNSMGTSIRDLIREQSINKLIKMSAQQHNIVGTTPVIRDPSLLPKRPVPFPVSNNANSGSNNNPPMSSSSSKDNRKILGKTLHAAGVALLINGTQQGAVPSLPPDIQQGIAGMAVSSSDDSNQLPLPAVPLEIAVSGTSSHHNSRANLDFMVTGSTTGFTR